MKTPLHRTKFARDFQFAKKYIELNFIVTKNLNRKLTSLDFVNEIKKQTGRSIDNEILQLAAREFKLIIEFQENSKNEYYNLKLSKVELNRK